MLLCNDNVKTEKNKINNNNKNFQLSLTHSYIIIIIIKLVIIIYIFKNDDDEDKLEIGKIIIIFSLHLETSHLQIFIPFYFLVKKICIFNKSLTEAKKTLK